MDLSFVSIIDLDWNWMLLLLMQYMYLMYICICSILSSLLLPNIVQNPQSRFVFHSNFDSFDKFVNELHNPGIFDFAYGIMLQYLGCYEVSDTKIKETTWTKARGFNHDADVDADVPCYVYL